MFLGKVLKGVGGAIVGGATGLLSGGPLAAIGGAARGSGLFGGGGPSRIASPGIRRGVPAIPALQPRGMQQRRGSFSGFRVGSGSVTSPFLSVTSPSVEFATGTGPSPAQARGASRLPFVGEIGVIPAFENVPTARCPRGQVLALDNLCYPKQMVPKQFRKWPHTRPPVTRGDQRAIQRAASTKKKLVKLTQAAGGHASLTKPRRQQRRLNP